MAVQAAVNRSIVVRPHATEPSFITKGDYMDTKEEVRIACDCGCSLISISKWDDDETVILSHYRCSFYTEQGTVWYGIKEYLKSLWFALLGKNFLLYELVLTKEDLTKLKEAL
jgi:hypothetical protein